MLSNQITAIVRLTEICNLRCRYCYVGETTSRQMSAEVLRKVVTETLDECENVRFLWHGGEPLLAGLDTFKLIVKLQEPYQEIRKVQNRVTINGTLLKKEWTDYFKSNKFRVSVSLDGPADIHDANRRYHNGASSFKEALEAIEALKDNQIFVRAVSILTKKSIGREKEIYAFFNKHGINFRTNPPSAANDSSLSITAKEFGKSMIEFYNCMMESPNGVEVRPANDYRDGVTRGVVHNCTNMNCFKRILGFDTVGNVYNCNRFASHSNMAAGNIYSSTLSEIFSSDKFHKMERMPNKIGCEDCMWKHICNGGCGHAAYLANGDLYTKTPFCEGRKMIFKHIAKHEGFVSVEV